MLNETDDAQPLCYASEEARTVLDSLSAHIAIVDDNGMILDTNQTWRDFAVKSGMPEDFDSIGDDYLAVCEAASGKDGENARAVAAGIREVSDGHIDEFLYDYPCRSELMVFQLTPRSGIPSWCSNRFLYPGDYWGWATGMVSIRPINGFFAICSKASPGKVGRVSCSARR